jgi:hypothetical protein
MRIALLLLLGSSIAFADRSYNDEGMTVTHDCTKDKVAVINGGGGTFTFTGACSKIAVNGSKATVIIEKAIAISVTGNGNTLTVDAADKISLTGNDNKLGWKKGLWGDKPAVSSIGTHNTVTKTP